MHRFRPFCLRCDVGLRNKDVTVLDEDFICIRDRMGYRNQLRRFSEWLAGEFTEQARWQEFRDPYAKPESFLG